MADEPQAQPDPGQDPQVTPDPQQSAPSAPAQGAPSPVGDGPWANDLATMFDDPSVRGRVDEFLRSRVQPYTTQLEQRAAVADQAGQIYQALQDDPASVYLALTNELFGEDAAAQVAEAMQQQQQGFEQPDQQYIEPDQQPYQDPNDPRLAWVEQKQLEEHYDSELGRILAEHPDVDEDQQRFHMFVAAAGGDFDEAYRLYAADRAYITDRYGQQAPQQGEQAPNVVGSDVGAAASAGMPVEKQYGSLDDAIEDFMRESRANKQAPPMGSV